MKNILALYQKKKKKNPAKKRFPPRNANNNRYSSHSLSRGGHFSRGSSLRASSVHTHEMRAVQFIRDNRNGLEAPPG